MDAEKKATYKGYPEVHGCFFDVKTGLLIDRNFDNKKKLEDIQEIFDLKWTSSYVF